MRASSVRLGVTAMGGCLALSSLVASAPAATTSPFPAAGPQAAPNGKPSKSPSPGPTQKKKPSKSPSPGTTPTKTADPPAPAPSERCEPPQGYPRVTGESWAQKRLAFERIWPLTRGQGVTTAVIDSGVEADHPMLAGRVSRFIDLTGTGKRDCVGHGTGVAAIVGGRDLGDRQIPLSGVAPETELLVVKNQNEKSEDAGGERLPRSIRKAVDKGADVINVSIRTGPSRDLADAVRYATRNDVVIVAGAGNVDKKTGETGPAYPANYAGVVSVASIGSNGGRAETSSLQTKVDVGAPGQDVYTAWTKAGYNLQASGTSYASAYVSGVAALVRSYHPRLRWQQVVHRLVVTADGTVGAGSGRGMVNPVQAVTAVLPEEGPAGALAPRRSAGPVRLAARAPDDGRTRTIALAVTGGALGLTLLVALGGVVAPLGGKRGWRPGRVTVVGPPPDLGDDEEGPADTARIGG